MAGKAATVAVREMGIDRIQSLERWSGEVRGQPPSPIRPSPKRFRSSLKLRRDLPSSDYGMASKTARHGLQRAKEESGHTRNSGGVRAGVLTRCGVRGADFVRQSAALRLR